MTSDNIGARHFPAGVAIIAALLGLALGALATFAITGLVWTVRVQLPPPPYPPSLSQAGSPGCVYPAPPSPGPGLTPPLLPPPPHA